MSRSHVAAEWDVLFVEGDGIYVTSNHVNAFKIANHDGLMARDDELASSYQSSMSVWEKSGSTDD